MQLYQQGDCLLKTGPIPKEAIPAGSFDLIKSVVTGHAHRVVGAAVLKSGDRFFVRSDQPFELVHEEHKTLTLPAGEYFMDHVQEYDHIAEEARAVAD